MLPFGRHQRLCVVLLFNGEQRRWRRRYRLLGGRCCSLILRGCVAMQPETPTTRSSVLLLRPGLLLCSRGGGIEETQR